MSGRPRRVVLALLTVLWLAGCGTSGGLGGGHESTEQSELANQADWPSEAALCERIRENPRTLERCVETYARDGRNGAIDIGAYALELAVAGDGTVASAELTPVPDEELVNPRLEECVVAATKFWSFPSLTVGDSYRAGVMLRVLGSAVVVVEPSRWEEKKKGWLSKQVIRETVHEHIGDIQRCTRGAAELPETSRIEVKFIIAPTGQVGAAQLASSTLGIPAVESCMVEVIRRMRFPEFGGGWVTVTYPFEVSPGAK